MPRAPVHPGVAVSLVGSPGLSPGQAAATVARGTVPFQRVIDLELQRQEALLFNGRLTGGLAAFSQAQNRLQLEAENQPPEKMVSFFQEEIEAEKQEILQGFGSDPRLSQAFEARTFESQEARTRAVSLRQRARIEDFAQAGAERLLAESRRNLALSPGNPDLIFERQRALEAVRELPGLSEVAKGRLIRADERLLDLFDAERLARENPTKLLEMTRDLAIVAEAFEFLTPKDVADVRDQAQERIKLVDRERQTLAEKVLKERQKEIEKEAIARIANQKLPAEERDPMLAPYTLRDFVTDSPDMSVSGGRAIFNELKSESPVRSDPEIFTHFSNLVETDPAQALAEIDATFDTLSIPDRDKLKERARGNLDDPGNVDSENLKSLQRALGRTEWMQGVEPLQAEVRAKGAKDEYLRFIEENPKASVADRNKRQVEILQAWSQQPIDSGLTLRMPFGMQRPRNEIAREDLAEAAESLRDALASGRISDDEYLRQTENLHRWQEDIERRERLRQGR